MNNDVPQSPDIHSAADPVAFGAGDGEMVRRVLAFDWTKTPLGPRELWPQSLKTAASIVLLSRVPIVMLWGADGVMIYNDAYSIFAGGRHPELLGSRVREGWPEVADFNDNVMKIVLAGCTLAYRDMALTLYRHGIAEQVWMDLDYSPIQDESGNAAGVMAIVVETTERKRADVALRRSEEQLRLATEAAEIGLWDVDVIRDQLYWPPRVKAMFGISPDQPISMADFYAGLHPADRDATISAYDAARDPARRAVYDVEFRTIGREDGILRWVAAKGRAVFDDHGTCLRVLGTAIDVTFRKRIEERLRELNETLERRVEERTAERDRVWRNSRDLLAVIGADGIFRAVNPAWSTILGHAPSQIIGRNFLDFVWPDDAHRSSDALNQAAAKHDLTNFENRCRHCDGTPRWISWHSSVEGDLVYAYGRDITDAKAQEAALAHAEAALRQAQKMEAMGQLTGGIAHDFNNLLQGIAGSLDLIRRNMGDQDRVRRWADAGLQTVDRGARLTAQLLAFSRSQQLELRPVDVGALLSGMRDLLNRTLGPAVRISLDLPDDPVHILSDPTQLEMAILNLAINARDAMPSSGTLTISARPGIAGDDPDLAPGSYVELAVADSGAGMPPDIAARAFDPFFTTKPIGKGSGLGLSQVYGMTRQAGGTARIESRPGQGTIVRLLLRQTEQRPNEEIAPGEPITAPALPATVLVVDDDPSVRQFLAESLDSLGYLVLEAEDGAAGLAILDRTAPDLLVVDYAMPGLTGADLAREAWSKRPDLPIVFASGYADTAAIEQVAGTKTAIIRKPFRIHELQDAVAGALRR